jgi:hypothetical protein
MVDNPVIHARKANIYAFPSSPKCKRVHKKYHLVIADFVSKT